MSRTATAPILVLLFGVILTVLGALAASAQFDVQAFGSLVAGVLLIALGGGAWTAERAGAQADLPDALWHPLGRALLIAAVCLFVLLAVSLAQLPNSIDRFVGVGDRTPTEAGALHPGALLLLGLAVVLIWVTLEYQDALRRVVGLAARSYARGGRWLQALLVALLLGICAFNAAQVLSMPFLPQGLWDEEAEVWRGTKEQLLITALDGQKQAGCLLCTPDRQPLENVSKGDDIGLFFLFGVASASGLGFEPSLLGYRLFIALSVGLAMSSAGMIVTAGFRSALAGLIFVIVVTFFGDLVRYESILITAYWTPAVAGLLTGALTLAFLARLEQHALTWRFVLVGFALWGLVAGLGYITRSSAGYVTLLSALLVWGWLLLRARRRQVLLLPVPLLIGFIVPVLALQSALSWRMTHYQLSEVVPNTMTSHAFSHGVLLGYGYVTNDWDIVWNDAIGRNLALSVCPGAQYLGPEYYDCIRTVVFDITLRDPLLLLRNLVAKGESIIQSLFSHVSVAYFLPVCFVLLRRRWEYLLFAALLLLQTVPSLLSVPYFAYLQGTAEILLAFFALAIIRTAITLRDADAFPAGG
ncbi:MAG: hypothetical protein JNJ61_12950 [Anaerolineae bacterium]|nr:hypothetical protein [Anaerolineae bacterium]